MQDHFIESGQVGPARDYSVLHAAQQRTIDALFRHPLAHNLEWSDALALIGKIGSVEHRPNNEFIFSVGDEHYIMHKPHGKDLSATEVVQLRQFLIKAGWSNETPPPPTTQAHAAAITLLVVVDHHEAKIYRLGNSSGDSSMLDKIWPYDPHHFLHHLSHKGQSRAPGQRAPEDFHFYEQIAHALVGAGSIILVGHGTGKSNAAQHLSDYLRSHDHAALAHVVAELSADLSAITTPQLLVLAQQTLS